ncbi:DUF1254 domain-containing protein [Conexibacter sp. W3-3-2]|nr:DUF1254 domain-containing protein [Conexibacter sp. W3-3-2]
MTRGIGATLAAVAVLLGAAATAPARQADREGAPNPVAALAVGQAAHEYGFPLLEFLRVRREMTSVRCPDERGNAPVNAFSNVPVFADASARTVVAPNTDTLYSIAHLDLGKGPIVLRHPAMGTRYFSFAMLDPYTNVIATPGTREDGGPGRAHPRPLGAEARQGRAPHVHPRRHLPAPPRVDHRAHARHRPGRPGAGVRAHAALPAVAPGRHRAPLRDRLPPRRPGQLPHPDRRRWLRRRAQPRDGGEPTA